MTSQSPDASYFQRLWDRYKAFTPGQKAELRRCAEPDDLTLTPAFYRLFPGERPDQRHRRLAFLLPWCKHRPGARPLATLLAEARVAESRARALALARHVLHMLATVVPTAKQQSHAAHNPADFAIVGFADLPLSLANAFERPVERAREGGYLGPSMLSIADYWQRLDTAYGLNERAAAFCFDDTPWHEEARREKSRRWPGKLTRYQQLAELGWIANDGQP